MTGPTLLGRIVLGLDVLALVGCGVLAAVAFNDTTSSTSAIGVAVALVLAVPVLVSLVLTGLGLRIRRRSPGLGTTLIVMGAVLTVGLFSLMGLQLWLGS